MHRRLGKEIPERQERHHQMRLVVVLWNLRRMVIVKQNWSMLNRPVWVVDAIMMGKIADIRLGTLREVIFL